MICSRRIYKGEDAEVSIPFLTTGWTSLYVEYFTDGDTKVVRQEDELEIDEYTITAQFEGDDLGLLDDGVIYYTIHYVYDDENYIKSSNTPYVLVTPAGYSGKTEDEVYEAGYEAGLEACSGGTPCDCTSAATQAYNIGFENGQQNVINQLTDHYYSLDSGFSGRERITAYPDDIGWRSVLIEDNGYGQGKYNQGFDDGFASGSTREVRFDMRVASAYEFHPLWGGGHSATINGNDAVVLDVFGTGNFDDYVVKVATLESGVTTLEVTLNFQNNGGGVLRIPSAFTSVQMNECYYLNILSQSRELVQEGRELKYKYSFTFDTTPFYDKLSYEAGLAACQGQ